MVRQTKFGPQLDRELDKLFKADARERGRVKALEESMSAMTDNMAAGLAVASPADPLKIDKATKTNGEIPKVAFQLTGTETDLTCTILRVVDNPASTATDQQKKDARAKRIPFVFNDITDEEREAKLMIRELRPALDFLTAYAIIQIKTRVVSNGIVGEAINPPTNPFKTTPFPYLNMVQPTGTVTGPAIFNTCDENGENCDTPISIVGSLGPGVASPLLPFSDTFKGKNDGVKPNLNFTIPKTLKTLKVVLIDEANFDPLNEGVPAEAIEDTFTITKRERGVGYISRRYGKLLDYDTNYILIRLEGTGENVGGPGKDKIRFVATDSSGIKDLTKNFDTTTDKTLNRAQFRTPVKGAAGGADVAFNPSLAPDNPFVDQTINSMTNLPNGFILENNAVFAIMNILLPRPNNDGSLASTATNIKARIITKKAYDAGKYQRTFPGDFDQITDDERTAAKLQRQFPEPLRYNTTYHLVQLVGEGANIGGPGIDKCKNPFPEPTKSVVLASFTTPSSDGTFPSNLRGNVAFLGITQRKARKRGIKVEMDIAVPDKTTSCRVKLLSVLDTGVTTPSAGDNSEVSDLFENLTLLVRTDGGLPANPGSHFRAFFSTPLDPGTLAATVRYRVIKITARGPNINPDGAGGPDPNAYELPTSGQATDDTTIGSFITAPTVSAPSVPVAADITNSPLTMDQPSVSVAVNAPVNFSDTGADTIGVTLKVSGSAKKLAPFTAPISDFSVKTQTIDIPGLVFAQKYELVDVFLSGGGDVSKSTPATTLTFRAGGEIDLSLLPLTDINGNVDGRTPPLGSSNRIQVFFTKERATEGKVEVVYNEPLIGSAILARKIRLTKFITGKSTVAKEFGSGQLLLKENADNFTPGKHSFIEDIKFPENANIILTATLVPLSGGGASITDQMSFDTGSDAGAMDDGFPSYVNLSPRVRLRWKPDILRAKFDLPDHNMRSFRKVRMRFQLTIKKTLTTGDVYYINPEQKTFVRKPFPIPLNTDLIVPGVDDATNTDVFVEVGLKGGDLFDFQKPQGTVEGDPNTIDGDLDLTIPGDSAFFDNLVPKTIARELREALALGRAGSLLITAYVYNDFVSTDPLVVIPALVVTIGTLFFPF